MSGYWVKCMTLWKDAQPTVRICLTSLSGCNAVKIKQVSLWSTKSLTKLNIIMNETVILHEIYMPHYIVTTGWNPKGALPGSSWGQRMTVCTGSKMSHEYLMRRHLWETSLVPRLLSHVTHHTGCRARSNELVLSSSASFAVNRQVSLVPRPSRGGLG